MRQGTVRSPKMARKRKLPLSTRAAKRTVFFPIDRGLKKSPDLFLVSSLGVPIEKCAKPWLFGVIMYVHI